MNISILNLKLELVWHSVSVMGDGGEILPESSQSLQDVVQIVSSFEIDIYTYILFSLLSLN